MQVIAVPGGDRVKGGAAVMVLLDGGQVTSAPLGSHVTLAVGNAGAAYCAVLSYDVNGQADIAWPAKGDLSGRLEGGPRERLAEFEVTPGSLTLRAFLTEQAVPLDALVREGGVRGATVVETRLEVTP
jgi:hypothetical protein